MSDNAPYFAISIPGVDDTTTCASVVVNAGNAWDVTMTLHTGYNESVFRLHGVSGGLVTAVAIMRQVSRLSYEPPGLREWYRHLTMLAKRWGWDKSADKETTDV